MSLFFNLSHTMRLALILAVALALGALAYSPNPPVQPPDLRGGTLLSTPRPIADYALLAESGAAFRLADLRGRWVLVFAGYTYCPEACPTTLAQIKSAKAKLNPNDAKGLAVLFLSVDPQRDTPERLSHYIQYFDPEFRAATGTEATLEAMAANLGLVYLKMPSTEGNYAIDHSMELVLIDPSGRLAGYLLPPFSPAKLAADLQTVLAYRHL